MGGGRFVARTLAAAPHPRKPLRGPEAGCLFAGPERSAHVPGRNSFAALWSGLILNSRANRTRAWSGAPEK